MVWDAIQGRQQERGRPISDEPTKTGDRSTMEAAVSVLRQVIELPLHLDPKAFGAEVVKEEVLTFSPIENFQLMGSAILQDWETFLRTDDQKRIRDVAGKVRQFRAGIDLPLGDDVP